MQMCEPDGQFFTAESHLGDEARRQAIHAARIVQPPVFIKPGLAFGLGPARQAGPLAAIVEQRHPKTARGLNKIDGERHDLPGAEPLLAVESGGEQTGIFGTAAKQKRFLNALRYLANELRISIVCLGTEEMMRVIRSVSSVENRFPPVVLPQWHIDNEFRKLLASFEKIIPLKYPSDLQDSTTVTAKLLTRSEGTIGELKTLLAAAATEAMRSGTERLTEEIIDGCNYVPPSTRKQRLARG